MHITVYCPHCQNRYQVEPALRGKRMRCLNTICRTVFEIREEEEQGRGKEIAAPPPAGKPEAPPLIKKPPFTGSVGEVVPVLAAEAAVSDQPDDLAIPGDDEDTTSPRPVENDGPVELDPGSWEAPPVRTISPIGPINPPDPNRRPRRIALIAAMLLVLGVVLGSGFYLVSGKGAANETERFKKAQELYHNQDFEEATAAFQKLLREFPSSGNRRQYDFLVELSAVRDAVYAPGAPPESRALALERVLEFLAIYKNDPLLKEYHGDVWHTLERLARELTTLAERQQDAAYLKLARRSWAEAGKFTPPAGASVADTAKALNTEFARADTLLAARDARLELLDGLRELATRGSADAVREGRALAKNAGMEHDPEVVPLLEKLIEAHRAHVVFTPAATVAMAARPVEDSLPSFYIAPRVGKVTPRRAPPRALAATPARETDVVLALARGVLYALDAARGNVRWVRRVGVDTTVLPLRVPASVFGPELVLVLSSDSKSVTAVAAATGTVIWQRALRGVCLGQPVLVDHHLLVPTLSGQVEDIETSGGALQGSYALDQPLVVGGVQQPGTSLVYFPADSYCVYVLDVAERTCAAIFYSGHAPGSMRGLPMIWNETDDTARRTGWLLLNLASGGDSMELRPYALPIREPDQKPTDLKIKVRGDSWAASWQDGEKLALTTNAGLLALYGIRQKGNRDDPLLFPLLDEDYRLESADRARQARAQVIHADAENYWVLSGGKLQRLQATFTSGAGPGLAARWPLPPRVGSPLHAGQVRVGADGLVTLFVTTQDVGSPTCWVRALDAEDGHDIWQRQLGMVCQDQPVAANDLVLSADAKGVFLFHAAPVSTDKSWQPAGTHVPIEGKEIRHWTFARAGGFVHLSCGRDRVLQVRLLDGTSVAGSRTHLLPAVPLGTPALGSDFVLLPLANGLVYRVPLGEGTASPGPEWRGVGIEDSQPGHIGALGNDVFAISDGGRSLMRLRWSEASVPDKERVTEMARRMTAAPTVLGNRLLVADASDTVTMLNAASLLPERHWSVGGKITAGPFVRAGGVGVVIGNNRLVWLDPAKDKLAWEYSFVAPIVGQPELVEGLLVVADLQGGITGLDPATGNPAGPGYRLKANEAPTAAPVAFGMGQVFMPLMDGTVMVLPMDKLR